MRFADIEDRAPVKPDSSRDWNQVLQRLAAGEQSQPQMFQLSQMRDDLTNYQWMNEVAFYQHKDWFERHPEENLYKGAIGMFSGKGAKFDHPATHKFFMESLHDYPELIKAYTRGTLMLPADEHTADTRWDTYKTQPHLLIPHTRIK